MHLPLPPAEQQTFLALASAAGYETVESYVADYLSEIAKQHADADLVAIVGDELQARLKMCDKGKSQADAGESKDFREALDGIAAKHGLPTDG